MLPDDNPAPLPASPDPAFVTAAQAPQFGFPPGVLDYQGARFYLGNPPHARFREMIRRSECPPGVRLGPNWRVWTRAELDAYLRLRIAAVAELEAATPRLAPRRRRSSQAEAA